MEKIAFLDFDGTLSKGYITNGFIDHLIEKNIYPKELLIPMEEGRKEFLSGKIDHDQMCTIVLGKWAEGLKNQFINTIRLNAMEFIKTYTKNIYPSSYKLVRYLKEKKYHPIIISAAPHEVISLIAEELGIRETYSTKVEVISGLYTGRPITNVHLSSGKAEIVKKVAEEKNIYLQKCIAIGDAAGDLEMLKTVGLPIVLNPHKAFLNTAEEKGWPIFYQETIMERLRIRIFDN